MNKWLVRGLFVLGVLLVLAGGAYYWFFIESGTPVQSYSIDLKEVRRLADSLSGDKPCEVKVEHVAGFSFAGAVVVASDGWQQVPMEVFAYKVGCHYAYKIIDTGISPAGGQEMRMTVDMDAWRRIRSAMKFAALIVVTHEHADHIGGILASPYLDLQTPLLKLNAAQYANLAKYNPRYRRGPFAHYKPITYDRYLAVAPGIVLIKSPGHTPGSQMVYIKTQQGPEFILTGDVAWTMRNIDTKRERARAATQFFLDEDRDAVLAQLAELNRIKAAEPNVHIVPGHDIGAVEALERKGLLIKGWSVNDVNYIMPAH